MSLKGKEVVKPVVKLIQLTRSYSSLICSITDILVLNALEFDALGGKKSKKVMPAYLSVCVYFSIMAS